MDIGIGQFRAKDFTLCIDYDKVWCYVAADDGKFYTITANPYGLDVHPEDIFNTLCTSILTRDSTIEYFLEDLRDIDYVANEVSPRPAEVNTPIMCFTVPDPDTDDSRLNRFFEAMDCR